MGLNTKSLAQEEAELTGKQMEQKRHILEEDYVLHLADKHNFKEANMSVKYWERKKGRANTNGRERKLQHMVEKKVVSKEMEEIQVKAVFKQFQRSGHIDDPEYVIPLPPVEEAIKLKNYIQEAR